MIALPRAGTALAIIAALFVAILLFVETGRRLGVGRKTEGLAAIERAVFGLMALLLAFTFSSAAVRFEIRRTMIVEEVNAINTAFLQIDLLPDAAQPDLREKLRRYVDARLEIYRDLREAETATSDVARVKVLRHEIWAAAVAACRESPQTTRSVLPAFSAMFAIGTTRTIGLQTHQHTVVFAMLAVVMLACSLLAGFSVGEETDRSWLHVVCFAAVLTVALYVILDLEYPRLGIVRIDWMDRFLREARQGMG
jgi:hypothetical protein